MSAASAPRNPPSVFGACFAGSAALAFCVWLRLSPWWAHDFAAPIVLCAGLFAVVRFADAVGAWDRYRDARVLAARHAAKAATRGRGRLGTEADAAVAGLSSDYGLWLGRLNGRDLRYDGENHQMIVAPPGASKGVSYVVPNLLSWRASKDWLGSVVVPDVKGSLVAVCARQQKAMGRRVVVLTGFREKMEAELGVKLGGESHNPLGFLDPASPEIVDDAALAAKLVLPGTPGADAKSEFFEQSGQLALEVLILFLLARDARVSLPALRRLAMTGGDDLLRLLADMSLREDFGGALKEGAQALIAKLENSGAEFQGAWSGVQLALKIYDSHGPLGRHCTPPIDEHGTVGGFDFATLKETATAVFLVLPNDRGATHGAWLRLVIASAVERIARARSHRKVLFLLEECANLGTLPLLLQSMSLHREFGVQYSLVLQQFGQLERLYGKSAVREMLGMTEILQVFGTREWSDLKLLSDLAGQRVVDDGNQSVRTGPDGRPEVSYSGGFRDEAVLRPDDIRRLPANRQLIYAGSAPPFLAEKLDYRREPSLSRLADSNPYYERA